MRKVTGKVRRVRYVPPYQVSDDNPYRDKSKPARKFWRTWKEIEVFENADLRQLDDQGDKPGNRFQLRVPMTDPETGRKTDADGDPALLRIEMVGATLDIHMGAPVVKGFVSKQELEHEKAYRSGSLDDCLSASDLYELDTEYVLEEWQVL